MILTGETDVLGGNLQHCNFVQHQSHRDRPVIENEPPQLLILIFVTIYCEEYSSEDLHVVLITELRN
jgi:hypothetical protein